MEVFYNATQRAISKILPEWNDSIRRAHINLLNDSGFKPVRGYDEPRSQSPFAMVEAEFEDHGEYFTVNWQEIPLKVKLSQRKLLQHPMIQSAQAVILPAIEADAELAAWWNFDLTYLRGSPMAKKAMAAFHLTQEQLEAIALVSRK